MAKELNKGEIYILTNKTSNKSYVGQAMKYVSLNNQKWGTEGRWKSHVKEALNGKKDHCRILNNAIRKYGSEDFEVKKICDCFLEEMDDMERKYIAEYNTVYPNGYNMTYGGQYSKEDSTITKEEKKIANEKKEHSEKTKEKISKGQLGNRRTTKVRRYEEDNNLPKYITTGRRNGVITCYIINSFPIGTDKKDYIKKSFSVFKYGGIEATKETAMKYLEELKVKYNYVEETIKENKKQDEKKSIEEIIVQRFNGKNNNEYIKAIVEGPKLVGYVVEGLTDHNGVAIPRREFKDNTNVWNHDKAIKYIQKVKKLVNEGITEDWLNISIDRRHNDHSNNLPPFTKLFYFRGDLKGYKVLFPLKTNDGIKTISKTFVQAKYTLEENKEEAIKFVEELCKQNKEYESKQLKSECDNNDPKNLFDIYMIKNRKDGKCYIGSVSQYHYNGKKAFGINGVWKAHLREYKKPEKSIEFLYKAMEDDGEESFEIIKLDQCEKDKIKELRHHYCSKYDALYPNGYNTSDGTNVSDVMRKKMGENKKNKQSLDQSSQEPKKTRTKSFSSIDLPEFMSFQMQDGKRIGYIVEGPNIPRREFNESYYDHYNYNRALRYLDQVRDAIKNGLDTSNIDSIELGRRAKVILPKFIEVVKESGRLKGYRIKKDDNEIYFIDKNNTLAENYSLALKELEKLNTKTSS